MVFVSFLTADAGLGELFERHGDRYDHCMRLGKHLMTGPSELKQADRELIAAYVSALNACSFCVGTHSAIARAFGWRHEVLESLLEEGATPLIPERLVPIMAFARALTLDPSRLTQKDADAVLSAGWSEQTLSDVAAITAYYAMLNRLASGHGVAALPDAQNEAIAQHIREDGYPDVDAARNPNGDHSPER